MDAWDRHSLCVAIHLAYDPQKLLDSSICTMLTSVFHLQLLAPFSSHDPPLWKRRKGLRGSLAGRAGWEKSPKSTH